MARRRNRGRQVNGIVLFDKPLNISSNFAMQQVKRLFNANKAGHTGSLDHLATGLLPICLGEATKVSSYLLDADKTYETVAFLGQTTVGGDREGAVLETKPVPELKEVTIKTLLEQFVGTQDQIPPMHSALKHNGKPLYKLARQGIEIERKARRITIYALTLTKIEDNCLHLTVRCSKGTYIRTLVEDIGKAVGCGAHVSALRRTAVAGFNAVSMVDISHLQQAHAESLATLDTYLQPCDSALQHWPRMTLSPTLTTDLRHGRLLNVGAVETMTDEKLLCLYRDDGLFLGFGQALPTGEIKPKRLLFLEEQHPQ